MASGIIREGIAPRRMFPQEDFPPEPKARSSHFFLPPARLCNPSALDTRHGIYLAITTCAVEESPFIKGGKMISISKKAVEKLQGAIGPVQERSVRVFIKGMG